MQLSDSTVRPIRAALTAATCSLLGVAQQATAQDQTEDVWEFDSTVLYYQESDSRVKALEPVFNARRQYGDDKFLNMKIVIDALTGATPNGATPTNSVQTFTRPSGRGSYTVQAGETPLDDTFHDTRGAASVAWDQPIDRMTRMNIGASASGEHDYFSAGINGAIARDFNNRNSTLSFGLGYSYDTIMPEGDIPIPLASMAPAGGPQPRQGSQDTKSVFDGLLGLTQVIDRQTLMQFNYTLTYSDGYHTDPYKLLSVVDGTPGATLGDPVDYVYEKRPDSRLRQSVYWQTKHHFSRDIVDASYRFFWDDWGIQSHTVDLHYRWQFSPRHYLEPHFRYYYQTEADFYRHSLLDTEPLPSEASADYRLASFTGLTLGAKYGLALSNGNEMSVRLEVYQQTGDEKPGDAIGSQRDQVLFPKLTAIIAQFSYSF